MSVLQPAAILVRDGTIAEILPPDAAAPDGVAVRDGEGMLLLPSFRDMHVHLDKIWYGGPWVAPRMRGIAGRIELQKALLPKLLPTLEKANLACQICAWRDQRAISPSLKLATGGLTPLDAAGEQVWPKPGDRADMVLVPASCSAEAVARLAPRKAVFHAGNLAAGA